jgi:hypothetical protein
LALSDEFPLRSIDTRWRRLLPTLHIGPRHDRQTFSASEHAWPFRLPRNSCHPQQIFSAERTTSALGRDLAELAESLVRQQMFRFRLRKAQNSPKCTSNGLLDHRQDRVAYSLMLIEALLRRFRSPVLEASLRSASTTRLVNALLTAQIKQPSNDKKTTIPNVQSVQLLGCVSSL